MANRPQSYKSPRPAAETETGAEEVEEVQQPERMASWLSRTVSSHPVQLAGTALLSGAVVAGAILGYQHSQRRLQVADLKASIPDVLQEHEEHKLTEFGSAAPVQSDMAKNAKEDERNAALALRVQQGRYDEELITEQLTRTLSFLSPCGLSALRTSFITIIGLGGVGSHACAALARSGVSRIRLVDFDQVTLSSLNRHAVATLADVGTAKVQCLKKRLGAVTPWVHFDARNTLFSADSAETLLAPWDGQPLDYVIDAIDNIDSKVALLAYCYSHSIPVISSMGAGCKSDPTRLQVGDISLSTEDPLSRATRRRLRQQGITTGIPVVYSTEKPSEGKATLLPLPAAEHARGSVADLAPLPDFRVRILPVLGTMPAAFGLAAANHVICSLARYPLDYGTGKARDKLYDTVLAALQASEERLLKLRRGEPRGLRLPLGAADVGYLLEEVWRGKSVVSGLTSRLVLVRWRVPGPEQEPVDEMVEGQRVARLKPGDLVCMTKDEGARHEKEVFVAGKRPEDVYNEDVIQLVERRTREETEFERYR